MTEVKICGLTREEDIGFVNCVKPQYVGFVFAESKRRVNRQTCKRLIDLLDKEIKTVGVFVNSSIEEVNEIAEDCKLDIVQLHGSEKPEYCNKINRKIWKAFRIQNQDSLKKIEEFQVDGYLLDAYHENQFGGTGTSFDWDLLKDISNEKQMILAGGITPDNVRQAIFASNACVIDVSSGVETNGVKDLCKMKILLERVRQNE